jgi:hypothetical protein
MFKGEDTLDVATSIRVPGVQTIITTEGYATSRFIERQVAIGKLSSADATPSVLLGGFTGGAHCCATLRVVTPVAGRLKVIEFEEVDGGPSATFPKDVDGDGTVDFVRQDDSFRYQFASGAGSYSPPVFLNIYKGQIVNVSDQPSFRPVWLEFANKTRRACADRSNEDRNGACIAYAAASSRLGNLEAGLKEAIKNAYAGPGLELPSPCKVDLVEYQCPEGQDIKFYTFEAAAIWFLRKSGYTE